MWHLVCRGCEFEHVTEDTTRAAAFKMRHQAKTDHCVKSAEVKK